jgi:hypothetical protein
MTNIPKVRKILEVIHELATYLNDDEIRDIGLVLQRTIDRIEKEQE